MKTMAAAARYAGQRIASDLISDGIIPIGEPRTLSYRLAKEDLGDEATVRDVGEWSIAFCQGFMATCDAYRNMTRNSDAEWFRRMSSADET